MKRSLLAVLLLFTVAAHGTKKTEDDFEWTFAVTASSAGSASAHRYCPMTLTAGQMAYAVYSQSWQCITFPVGSQVKGTFTKGVNLSITVHANEIELMYYAKDNKLHTVRYVVDSQAAVP
jgi:hypothetical protein